MIFLLTVLDFHTKNDNRKKVFVEKIYLFENIFYYKISVKENFKNSDWKKLHSYFDYNDITILTPKTDILLPK